MKEEKKEVIVVLPARLKSSRLPNKMLEDVGGVPLIVASAKNAQLSGYEVIVATDDQKILDVCVAHNINCELTPVSCESGTDRLAFLANKHNWDNKIILNVQGDEPILEKEIMNAVVELITKENTDMSTACVSIQNKEEWLNPNCVKVVISENKVLYFSRAPVPFDRDSLGGKVPNVAYRHLGVYAYKGEALKNWINLKPSLLENIEKLEQWRALENGWSMSVHIAKETKSISVDKMEDLLKLREFLKK